MNASTRLNVPFPQSIKNRPEKTEKPAWKAFEILLLKTPEITHGSVTIGNVDCPGRDPNSLRHAMARRNHEIGVPHPEGADEKRQDGQEPAVIVTDSR